MAERTPVTTTITWDGTQYDVSDAVIALTVSHGSSAQNPALSTVAIASGYVDLQGAQYEPGNADAVAAEEVLLRPAPVRVSQGATTLWSGFTRRAHINTLTQTTRYALVGRLWQYQTRRADHAHTSTTFPEDSVWIDLIGQAPILAGVSTVGIEFAPFTFEGPALQLLARMGVVLGRLVGEDRLGRPVMPVYGRDVPTASLVAIDGSVNTLRPSSRLETEQIRNRISLFFPGGMTETTRAVDTTWTLGTGGWPATQDFNVTLPTAASNETYGTPTVEVLSATADAVAIWDSRTNPDRVWGLEYASLDLTDHITATITTTMGVSNVTLTNSIPDPYTWQSRPFAGHPTPRTQSTAHTTTGAINIRGNRLPSTFQTAGPPNVANPATLNDWVNAQVQFRISWTVTTGGPDITHTFDNLPSAATWGTQTLDFPKWVAPTGLDPGQANANRIQTDLNHLAQARTYHTITIPLWQPTPTLVRRAGEVDYGTYLDLNRWGLNTIALVTHRTLTIGTGTVPSVTIQALETGQTAATLNIITVDTIPLAIDTQQLALAR